MKKRIEISTTIIVEFDPTSEKFKNTLEAFQEQFEPSGGVDDLLTHIMSQVARYGTRDNIECIGHVSENMEISGVHEDWCGVDICDCESDINGMLDYDIYVYDKN